MNTNKTDSPKSGIFVHMPKCAGTSLRHALQKTYPDKLITDYDSAFKVPLSDRTALIDTYLNAPEPIAPQKFIYGHFFPIKYIGAPGNLQNHNISLVTILRDPLERLISNYNYWQANQFPQQYIWQKMTAQNWTFEDFALCPEFQNIYSQICVHITPERFDYIGLYERLDISVKTCLQHLGLTLDFGTLPKNNITPVVDEKTVSSAQSLEPDLMGRIKNFHNLDYELYNYAVETFH